MKWFGNQRENRLIAEDIAARSRSSLSLLKYDSSDDEVLFSLLEKVVGKSQLVGKSIIHHLPIQLSFLFVAHIFSSQTGGV